MASSFSTKRAQALGSRILQAEEAFRREASIYRNRALSGLADELEAARFNAMRELIETLSGTDRANRLAEG